MVRMRVVMAALALGLLGGAARAGVYDLDDPLPQHLPPLPSDHAQIQLILQPLRAAGVPRQPNTPVSPYQKQAEALEAKAAGDRTTADRIDLGACYIRLNRPNDAIRVLSTADQSHFLVLANLAAAYQEINELDRAIAYDEQALALWPSIQPGWNGSELRWYRRAEGFYLKLLESRQRESQANPANRPAATMDLLFGRPRASAGDYEAQELPWKLWGDLPPDAFAIVSQLLVWSPNDDRLYWQLGEVLNSLGLLTEADQIFDELANTRNLTGVREFMEHRQALKESLKVANALVNTYGNDTARYQRDCHIVLLELAPPGLLCSPGLGQASNAVAPAAEAEWYVLQEQQPGAGPGAAPPSPRRGWWPDWKPIFVGFAGGFILATLAVLQWMEWRKRRRPETRPSPRTEPVAHDAGAFRADDPSAPDRVEGAP